MASKQNQLLLVAVAVVAAGGFFYWQTKKENATTNTSYTDSKASTPQIKVVPEEIDRLTIKAKDKAEVVLEKKPEGWVMVSPVKTPKTQKSAVDDVLNGLKGMTFKDAIAKGQNYFAEYDLTPEKAIHVVAGKGGGVVVDLWLGAQKSRGQMAHLGNDDQVWALHGLNAFTFDKAPKDFRDRKVWDLARDSIVGVELKDAKGTFSFAKAEAPAAGGDAGATDATADAGGDAGAKPTWTGTVDGKPMVGLEPARIDDMLNAFALGGVLNADDFGDGKSDAETGLAAAEVTSFTFRLKDGSTSRISLGKTDGTKRYARKDGDTTIFLLAEGPSSWAEVGVDKFVPAPPAGGDAGADGGKSAADAGKAADAK